MKFSEDVIEKLQNFASINPSIVIKPGGSIATISPTKTILAKAKVDEPFDAEFGIFDLGLFLDILKLFKTPTMTILDKGMTIAEGSQKINFVFANASMILQPPEKEIKFGDPEVTFSLSDDDFSKAKKAAGTLGSPELAITGDGESIHLEAINTKNSADNSFKIKVGETKSKFKAVFLIENIKLLPRDYKVEVKSAGIAKFSADDIEYFIAVEQGSSEFGNV